MERIDGAVIVRRPSFEAVGLNWEGTFAEAEAGGIRAIQRRLKELLGEVRHVVDGSRLLGLSYHAKPGSGSFAHWAAVEVSKAEEIPDGMGSVRVPALTYARCSHRKGQSIDRSYQRLYEWIEEQGCRPDYPGDLTHFEEYPMAQDPYDRDPEFTILIPIRQASE